MDNKESIKEKLIKNKKIVIPVIISIVFIAIAIVIVFNNNNDSSSKLTQKITTEEKFAVDYLVKFAGTFKNPHSIKLYKVWVYVDSYKKYYVAYNLSAKNDYGAEIEGTYACESGIQYTDPETKIDIGVARAMYAVGTGNYWEKTLMSKAEKNGTLLNADKIQKLFEEAY